MTITRLNEAVQVYNYTPWFSYEENFDYFKYYEYHGHYWTIVFPIIGVYLGSIFWIQSLMRDRSPFALRSGLFYWNVALAVFSIGGAARSIPELYYTLKDLGLNHAICIQPHLHGVYGFWVVAFIISKFFELGDTFFIVLRKQKLIFLHWYHHVTVIFCVFFTVTRELSTLRWYVTQNYAIHSIMYTYYALRAVGVKIPKAISISITSLQIMQMFVALFITSYALFEKISNRPCFVDNANIALGLVCYGSYAVLFGNFFIQTYFRKTGNRSKVTDAKIGSNKTIFVSNNNVLNGKKRE